MPTYLVTYDLNKETKRPDILKTIKDFHGWAKLSESSYAVSCDLTVDQVYGALSKHLDSDDTCYVISLRMPYTGRGPQSVNDWLQSNLRW